jgi:dienelactone hydrolase
LSIAGAVIAVVAVAALVTRDRGGSPSSVARRLAVRTAPVLALVLVAQACAVTAVALTINNRYGFYTSWSDLMGKTTPGASIQTSGLVTSHQGAVHAFTLHSHVGGPDDQVLVWTPPQYDTAQHPLPVVMFMPGQPSAPQVVFRQFRFAQIATHLIESGKVPPFVAVFPTLMIDPPRDTECTNVPGGPRAFSWLDKDVPAFVTQHYHVQPLGRGWSTMGWSTGGFCATKLLTAYPKKFSSAVSFGGYYQPLEDHTTGNLFAGKRRLQFHNSPLWLYLRDVHDNSMTGSRMLLIAGMQDKETWPATIRMISVARGDPAVAHIAFPTGGHNFHNYRNYLPSALQWVAAGWPR